MSLEIRGGKERMWRQQNKGEAGSSRAKRKGEAEPGKWEELEKDEPIGNKEENPT